MLQKQLFHIVRTSTARIWWQQRVFSHDVLPRFINNSSSSTDFDIDEEFIEPFNERLVKQETVNRGTLIHKFKHLFNLILSTFLFLFILLFNLDRPLIL